MIANKVALRASLRSARRAAARAAITVPGAFLARLAPGLIIASYIPVGSEADPAPLARAALDAGGFLALPHVSDRAQPLRFLAWTPEAALVAGPFGLRQPPDDAEQLAPDIILTPLVGFDRSGARLGQGAGHYDRAFAEYPNAWRTGIAYACQEVATLPTDVWDIPLHAIATEREWIEA
jgi:5-formyltetrahydrofolate cyclo-ligase